MVPTTSRLKWGTAPGERVKVLANIPSPKRQLGGMGWQEKQSSVGSEKKVWVKEHKKRIDPEAKICGVG